MKIAVIGCLTVFFYTAVDGQQSNWQNKDLQLDSVFGISTEKAYNQLLQGKKAKQVIVAIIDSGIDTLHEDLKSVLWTNPKDGSHGWNYIGPETGKEDVTNLTGDNKDFYDSLSYTLVPEAYRIGYQQYRKMAPALSGKLKEMNAFITNLSAAKQVADNIVQKIGKYKPMLEDFKSYHPENDDEALVVNLIIERWPLYKNWEQLKFAEIDNLISLAQYHVGHGLNVKNLEKDTANGNGDVSPDALGLFKNVNLTANHGTHIAGIIGAMRNNGIGMDGISNNVKIMMLKVVGNIRELRDKSLANAIYFAVRNGAKIINLSFGKPYTWNKKVVDEAVKFAMRNDVLIIHAAGNSGVDLDQVEHYPNPVYADGSGIGRAWVEVGASGYKDDEKIVADFSNYGKSTVNVFAPGVNIYSTIPGSTYDRYSGTSMAAPIVAGLAAIIRGYYPKLTALQVKHIIMLSVIKRDILKDKCISSGIVNAYNSLKLAETYK